MAARKTHHRFLDGGDRLLPPPRHTNFEEFDEADVWSTNDAVGPQSDPKPKLNYSAHRPIWKSGRKSSMGVDPPPLGPKSLPVNVPDWSKILRGEYRNRAGEFTEDDEDEEEEYRNDKMPPHEYLARTRKASFSVHEGVGRTLKGRDLSRVRNAIWKQIGLIDED